MELKDLKRTWDKLAPDKELDEEQIMGLLRKRTGNLIDRIDRNIRIALVVLFVFIVVSILDDFVFAPILIKNMNLEIPKWLLYLNIITYIFILSTYIYFAVLYFRVKNCCDILYNLREILIKYIAILLIYKRLFYFAIVIILITIFINFLTGIYLGKSSEFNEIELVINYRQVFFKIFFILIVFIGVIIGFFIFFQKGFNRYYGDYNEKLRIVLKELDSLIKN
jgi:hypothetical protein